MKKGIWMCCFLLLLSACTAGKRVAGPGEIKVLRTFEFPENGTLVTFRTAKSEYLIDFFAPLPGEKCKAIRVNFRIPHGKEGAFLEWTETGRISPGLAEYVTVSIGGARVEDPAASVAVLASLHRSGAFRTPFFYVLGRNGRVAEIQGVDDRIRLEMAAKTGSLSYLYSLRQQISLLGLQDLLGVANTGSRRLGAAAGLGTPFFLALDDLISGLGLAHEAFLHLTRDARAEKLLASAASVRDRCLMVLTEAATPVLRDSAVGLRKVLSACREYLTTEKPEGPELVRTAKASGKAAFLLFASHRKEFFREKPDFVLNVLARARPLARTYPEKFRIDLYRKLLSHALSGN